MSLILILSIFCLYVSGYVFLIILLYIHLSSRAFSNLSSNFFLLYRLLILSSLDFSVGRLKDFNLLFKFSVDFSIDSFFCSIFVNFISLFFALGVLSIDTRCLFAVYLYLNVFISIMSHVFGMCDIGTMFQLTVALLNLSHMSVCI